MLLMCCNFFFLRRCFMLAMKNAGGILNVSSVSSPLMYKVRVRL